jgi:hypothetical protein
MMFFQSDFKYYAVFGDYEDPKFRSLHCPVLKISGNAKPVLWRSYNQNLPSTAEKVESIDLPPNVKKVFIKDTFEVDPD